MYVDKDINVKKISHWGDYFDTKKACRRSTKPFWLKRSNQLLLIENQQTAEVNY